jgi:hypothetical protein
MYGLNNVCNGMALRGLLYRSIQMIMILHVGDKSHFHFLAPKR